MSPHRSRVALGAGVALLALAVAVASAAPRTIPRSRARAIAEALTLRPSDLPTLNAHPSTLSAQAEQSQDRVAACEGTTPPRDAFAIVRSPTFGSKPGQGGLVIGSVAAIQPTTAVAAHNLAASMRPHALSCAADAFAASLRTSLMTRGIEIVRASATRIPSQLSGVDGSLAVRLALVLSERTRAMGRSAAAPDKVPGFDDVYDFYYGQAQVELSVVNFGAPPPGSLEHHLAELLVSRTETAIG